MKYVATYKVPLRPGSPKTVVGVRLRYSLESFFIDAATEREALTIAWQGEKPDRMFFDLATVKEGELNLSFLTDYDPAMPIRHSRHIFEYIPITTDAKRVFFDAKGWEALGVGLVRCRDLGEYCYWRMDEKLFTYPKGEWLIPAKGISAVEALFHYTPIRIYFRPDGSFDREKMKEIWCFDPLVDWFERMEARP